MSSIFSLLPDILPMILPSAVTVVKGSDLETQRPQDSPMIRQGAIIGKSDRMCATETIIYAAAGKGILVTNPAGEGQLKRHELSAGDFAFVPPWTEHQEINETDDDVVWILVRTGPEPVVVWLTGWDGDHAKAD
ncbi:RmlC-like cupin domain-containing protein [Poronia punctata]|nr:RmlC-like cupin domain-containing protein [Poronia punctata]